MSYRIELVPEARGDVRALPAYVRAKAVELLAALAADPRPSRARQLLPQPCIHRIWLAGRWRVVYEVDDTAARVLVLQVRRRQRMEFDDLPSWVQEADQVAGFGAPM